MAKAKKAAPKKIEAKKAAKAKPVKLGQSGKRGGILFLSGKPLIKTALKKKAAPKKKNIKLGGRGTNSGGGQ